jgi:hypothetical protein
MNPSFWRRVEAKSAKAQQHQVAKRLRYGCRVGTLLAIREN